VLATIVILAWGLMPESLSSEGVSRLRASLRSNLFNQSDIERIDHGYYEKLIMYNRRLDDLADLPCLRTRRQSGSMWSIPVEDAPLITRVNDLREVILRRNDSTKRWGLAWRTNSQGMRDKHYATHKPSGTICIALVGDSIGAGWGVNAEERFESILERVWDQRAWTSTGLRVEIINCAVPGHSPGQRWHHFTQIGWPMEPDLVIYEGTAADVGWDERRLRFLLARGLAWTSPIYEQVLTRAGIQPGRSPDYYKRALRPIHREILTGVYQAMAADCHKRAIPIVWVLLPRVGRKNDTANQHILLKTAQAVRFSSVVDLTNAYDGLDPVRLAVDSNDFHPNVSGHERLAQQLDRALSELPEITRIWGRRSAQIFSREWRAQRPDGPTVRRLDRNAPALLAPEGAHNL
jgi:hypothetical protein